MAFTHGKQCKVYVNGFDLSFYFTKVGVVGKADVAEVSTLGTTDKGYLNGMMDGTLSADGFYSDGPNQAASVLGSAFLVDTPASVVTMSPQGDSFGAKSYSLETALTDYEVSTDTGNAGAITLAAQSKVGLDTGQILHPLGQEAASGNGSPVDNGVVPGATAAGLDSYLQVTQSSGGNLTVKTQHSADNITYVDLCTHTLVTTARKAERVSSLVAVPSGSVLRYIRASWAITGTATFFLAAARLSTPH